METKVPRKVKWDSISKLEGLNYSYIKGSTGYYVVDDGRVFSIANGGFLKLFFDSYGYVVVNIYYHDGMKTRKVHRLVADAFIPNVKKLEAVNHKNEIKTDNSVGNLEWVTVKQNNNYGTRQQRAVQKIGTKPVYEYSGDGDYVCEFDSAGAAAAFYGCHVSSIRNVCMGWSKSFDGKMFRYFKTDSVTGLTERQKKYTGRYRKDGKNSA